MVNFSFCNFQISAVISLTEEATTEDCAPVGLQYLYDQQAVCVALSDGRICLLNTSDPEKVSCI
jgi:hypothetical protein